VHSWRRVFYNRGHAHGDRSDFEIREMLGWDQKTGIDWPSEEPGCAWRGVVQRVFHHKWYPGSTIFGCYRAGRCYRDSANKSPTAIGASPRAEFSKQPHLLKDAARVVQMHVDLAEEHVEQVTQGM